MILATIEIFALLTVSCLIGMFFTNRFWKAKFSELQSQNNQHKKKIIQLNGAVNTAKLNADKKEKNMTRLIDQQRIIAENDPKDQDSVINNAQKVHDEEVKGYEKEIALLKIEKNEKERELEVVSDELELRKISYYKHIDGKRYKAATLNMADEAIEGQGDGRISMEEAEKIFDTISNGTDYTQVEKHTIKYLRDNYNWTEEADELFRTKVRSWAASDHELV